MHVLRAEKGYIIVGQDTDGTVTPLDAGLAWAIGRKKPDFVGKRSLERAPMQSPDRKQLVGLRTGDAGIVLEEGAQLTETPGQSPPMKVIGHVTSSYASAALGHPVALAMVAGGRAREGRDAPRADAGRRDRGHGDSSPCSTTRKERACMADANDGSRRLAPAARFILQGERPARDAAGRAFGVALPEEACRAHADGERAALWLGPDEQLLLAPAGEAARLQSELGAALQGCAHSLVEVSQRQLARFLGGPRARDLLASGCPLDLDPEIFPGRHVHADAVCQGRGRFVAAQRRGVPSGSRAFLCRLRARLDARSESVGLPVTYKGEGDHEFTQRTDVGAAVRLALLTA